MISVNLQISPSITISLFHCWLKTHLFNKSFPSFTQDCLQELGLLPDFQTQGFFVLVFLLFFLRQFHAVDWASYSSSLGARVQVCLSS